jgi:hypothetical protein
LAFQPGDRVAWDHIEATKHAEGSIIREEALPDAQFGEVKEVNGSLVMVAFPDGWKELTAEELVRVEAQ